MFRNKDDCNFIINIGPWAYVGIGQNYYCNRNFFEKDLAIILTYVKTMETVTLGTEDDYLDDLQQKLVGSNQTAKIERLPNAEGLKTIQILRNPAEWSSTSLLKYSPPFFTLVSLTGSSLSIVTLTHNEETVEEVDFKVDLNQAPDEALVDFVSNSLGRQVEPPAFDTITEIW